MTPVEKLSELVEIIFYVPEHITLKHIDMQPCEYFNSLPPEVKECLSKLKSEDLRNLRVDTLKDMILNCQFKAEWAKEYRKRHPKN